MSVTTIAAGVPSPIGRRAPSRTAPRYAAIGALAVGLLGAAACKSPPPEVEVAAAPAPPHRPPPPSALSAAAPAAGEPANPAALTPGFVRVSAGRVILGSPASEADRSDDELEHEVTLRNDFEMAATEVTVADYRALMGAAPAAHQGCDDCPVEQVSWFEAARFCEALSIRRKLPPCTTLLSEKEVAFKGVSCPGFRLPTEAEWEHAARGGSREARYGEADAVAVFDTNSGLHSHPVGSKAPNAYGLYDMLGNVSEWVWDWQGDYPSEPTVDPTGPATGTNRVFRGGAYRWPAAESRAAFRNAYGPLNKVEFIGFRCVRTLPRP